MGRRTFLTVLVTLTSTSALASVDSAAVYDWRHQDNGFAAGLTFHSNAIERGEGLFHRPLEDLSAQKAAVISHAYLALSETDSLYWDSPIAIQDRQGTRAEIPYVELRQQLRWRRELGVWKGWRFHSIVASLLAVDQGGSLRMEAGVTGLKELEVGTVETMALHNQGVLGENHHQLGYGHLQLHRSLQWAGAQWVGLVRLFGEFDEFDPRRNLWGSETSFLARWSLQSWDVLGGLRVPYRGDSDSWGADLSVGLQKTW